VLLPVELLRQFDYFNRRTILAISQIHQGLCNKNYRVDCADGSVLFRVFGPEIDEAGRAQEFAMLEFAHQIAIAPRPLAYYGAQRCPESFRRWCHEHKLVNRGAMISEFFDGQRLSQLREINPQQLALLAKQIARLHHHGTTSLTHQSQAPYGLALLQQYWQLFKHKNSLSQQRYQGLKNNIAQLSFEHNCLIHGDLNGGNLLINEHRLSIIDWEFCSAGDRYFDLATVMVELDLSDCASKHFVQAYCDNLEITGVNSKKLQSMQVYYLGLCWLWQPNSLSGSALVAYQQRYADKLDQMLGDASQAFPT